MLGINEIKNQLKETSDENMLEFVKQYQEDSRSGVQKLVEQAKKRHNALCKEKERMELMKQYERENCQYTYIAGIDEVGRGPLAGPVVTCAVILPKDCDLLYINDSKKLSEAKRESLAVQIKECAIAYSFGIKDHQAIDEWNILQATLSAMRDAIAGLSPQPELMLNDAVTIPGITIPQIPIIKGDAKSISIAAASILAKVERDHMMQEFAKMYPEYGFDSNKGYGSAGHIEAIKKYGPCPIHRNTFIKNFI